MVVLLINLLGLINHRSLRQSYGTASGDSSLTTGNSITIPPNANDHVMNDFFTQIQYQT